MNIVVSEQVSNVDSQVRTVVLDHLHSFGSAIENDRECLDAVARGTRFYIMRKNKYTLSSNNAY